MDGAALTLPTDPNAAAGTAPRDDRADATGLGAAAREGVGRAVADWFAGAQRPLPWREGYDPYAVWVSEMMLQQTQVETVKPYFARWMARFPDVAALAAAPLEDVLKHWEGLGYYARARNLHRAAREIVERHDGALPRDPQALEDLPGIGPYSAGAVASIAYNVPAPVVDGNVGRVLSRLVALPHPPRATPGRKALWALAGALIPEGRAREFNQGLMELGAVICRARDPACGLCPVREHCRAFATGEPTRYPLAEPRRERREVSAVLAVVSRGGRWLLRRRPAEGLWGGLWEFPWAEVAPGQAREAAWRGLLTDCDVDAATGTAPETLGTVEHGLTHLRFRWDCWALRLGVRAPADVPDGLRWVSRRGIGELPLGRPMHKVLALLDGNGG